MNNDNFSITIDQFECAQSEIYKVLIPTPQINWPLLDEVCGTKVWVKHENQLPTGSFKVRGGLNFAQQLSRASAGSSGFVAATRGNHGQSVAFAAHRHGLPAVIVVPHGNNPDKNHAILGYGAELVEHGRDFDEAFAFAKRLGAERGLSFFPSFDPHLVCGVGTYAIELFRALPDLHTIYVPIGLGSGICGVIAARDALKLETRIVGVVAASADAYAQSFHERRPCTTDTAETIADGLAVRTPDPRALEIIISGAERIISVSDAEIMHAMRVYFWTTHNVAEAAGAAPLAALLQEADRFASEPVGLVLTGSNVDSAAFASLLANHQMEQGFAAERPVEN